MAQQFQIKENNTFPSIKMLVEERDSDGTWQPVDLTGATVVFKMRNSSGTLVVSSAGAVHDGANGIVRYDWVAADTATADTYTAEFDITTAAGKVLTAPSRDRDDLYVVVRSDVG